MCIISHDYLHDFVKYTDIDQNSWTQAIKTTVDS